METKVRLSLVINGATRLSERECQENPKESFEEFPIKVEFKEKGRTKYERLVIRTRKNRLVKQSIQLSKEAYDYMTSNEIPDRKLSKRVPFKKNGKKRPTPIWETYTDDQKLRWHFKNIADSLGAVSFNFEILDD